MENKYVAGGTVTGGWFLTFISHLDWPTISYIVGIFVAVIGLVAGIWWQWRKDKRDEAIMKATLEALRNKGVTINDD